MPLMKKNVLCVVCSAGGHLTEALLAVQGVEIERYFVTYSLPHIEGSLQGERYHLVTNPHKNPFKYLVNVFQSLCLLLKERPRFILSTGSGMALATCLIGKACGAKVIFVETGARVHTPSLTGRCMYLFSDLFIVQWEGLLSTFPKAKYGGLLF